MNIRRPLLPVGFTLALATFPVAAQNATLAQPATTETSKRLKEQASALRQEAEARLRTQSAECYSKFFVNSCLDDAKKQHTASVVDARKLEAQAREIERDVRARDKSAEAARKAVEAPVKQQEEEQEAARNRASRDLRMEEAAQRDAERARRLEEGKVRAAREAEARARRDAEKAERRSKEAERARQRAEKHRRQQEERARRGGS